MIWNRLSQVFGKRTSVVIIMIDVNWRWPCATFFDAHWRILAHIGAIVAKKWEPGNLVPSRFSGKIRKIEARLGKLAKIRKVETD